MLVLCRSIRDQSVRYSVLWRYLHLSAMPPKGKGIKRKQPEVDLEGEEKSEEDVPPPAKRAPKVAKGKLKKQKAGGEGSDQPAAKKRKKGQDSTDGGPKLPDTKSADGNSTDWSKVEIPKWNEFRLTKDGRAWNKKFSCWNVNGIRAWLKNGGLEYIKHEDPEIFCLQETKCSEDDMPKGDLEVPGYHNYWYSAETKGYSGTGLYTKTKPLNVTFGMGIEAHDKEGRIITAEFEKYFFITTYVPNAGEKLKRLDYRQVWDVDYRAYLKKLDEVKPIIVCGDLNVAHEEIDLANPKTNKNTAGFTKEEREGFTLLLKEGFVDSFRHLYPDRTKAFSYWSYRFNARARNIGWRLDYYVISERLTGELCDCVIRNEVYGSDHCPLVLAMAFN